MSRIRLRYSNDALEIFRGRAFNLEMLAVLVVLAAISAVVVALSSEAMPPVLWVVFAGVAATVAATALYAATRSLHVVVRKGEISWTRSAFGHSWGTRTIPEAELGALSTAPIAWRGLRATQFVLRLGEARGRPQIDGFTWRNDAEALGKLIAAELRHGPAARAAVHREPDVAALLGRRKPD